MEHEVSAGEYKDLLLFLATAGIVAPLLQRIRISPILGFLAAGVALGPYGLGALADRWPWLSNFTVSAPEEMAQLAEFGVAFLLFTMGLELSWERLRLMRRLVFGLGSLQVGLCGAVIGLAAWLLGVPPGGAASIGAALALSSTAVTLPVLAEHKRLHTPAGRAAFSVLLFQDLAVAPILIVLGVLASQEQISGLQSLLALGPAVFGLAMLVLFGRLLLRPMMRSVARTRSEELFLAATLLVVIGAGLLAAVFGLSMALGAFVAGLLIAETEYRHDVELKVEPFKGLLLGLFFVSVGINLDLGLLARQPLVIAGVAASLIVVKGALVVLSARAFDIPRAQRIEAALALAAGGEFAFVILNEALGAGTVSPAIGEAVLIAATLTMFLIPLLVALGAEVGRRADGRSGQAEGADLAPPDEGSDEPPRVLIVGFGRVGQLVAEMLTRHEIAWVAIDRSPLLVRRGRHDAQRTFFGDASQPELLKRVGLMSAPAMVVTMDEPDTAEAVVSVARNLRGDMPIVARARDARHAARLYTLGATNAVPETIEASLQLSEAVLVDVGVPMGFVIASIHDKRDEFRTLLNQPERPARRSRAD